jgi:hypothetical protein
MPISSNQYIQKISGEHPIALWSLDDDAYYVKLVSDSGRDLINWTNGNAASVTNVIPENIVLARPDRPCTEIVGSQVGTIDIYGNVSLTSQETFNSNSKPFTVSYNLYSYGVDIRYCEIGYQIGNAKNISALYGKTGDNTQVTYRTSSSHGFSDGDYVTVSGTVPNSANAGAYDQAGTVEVVSSTDFRINSGLRFRTILAPNAPGGQAFKGEISNASDAWLSGQSNRWLFLSANFNRDVSNAKIRLRIWYDGDYEKTFLINGLDVGQDSAEFMGYSSGQTPVALPSNIATDQTHGVLAQDYGTDYNLAYYIVKDNTLCTVNSSIPMISGSSNTTILYPNIDAPSLIFPGFGFLNESGKYKTYNLEFFIRVNGSTTTPKRIVGPLQSTDGIYVNGSSIILKINNLIKTAYIGEWFKPMLVNLQYTDSFIELWVNGDKLITMDIRDETIVFPEKIASSGDFSGKDQDWLGFYSYDDFESIEIDTIAIYPYVADISLIKRRILYAQAVKTSSLENLSIQTSGNFMNFRYDTVGEFKNYVFPTFSRWNSASVFDNLSVVDGKLYPKEHSFPEFYVGSKAYSDWMEDQSAVQNEASKFITLKPDSSYDDINGYIYINPTNIFLDSLSAIYAVVKKPESSIEEQRLITIYDTASTNYFKVSLTETTLSYVLNYSGVDKTDVDTVIEDIPMDTKISVGLNLDVLRESSDPDTANFFRSGNLIVYIGGFPEQAKTFDGYIYTIGLCNARSTEEISSNFTNGIANYSESLESNVATYTLLPKDFINEFILDIATKSYWESSVFLANISSYQDDVLDLDFAQINLDYPESTTVVDGNFDTSLELVKSYISFQTNVSGLNQTTFDSVEPLPSNKIINARTLWEDKKYEFTDHTLIYPPSNINLNDYSVVIHLSIISNMITSPTNIKYLELIGKSISESTAGTITAESSEKVEHYYLNENNEIDYKNNSGIFITKQSTSYINLNKNSGIKVVNVE